MDGVIDFASWRMSWPARNGLASGRPEFNVGPDGGKLCSVRLSKWLGFTDVTPLNGGISVLKYRHCREHAEESKLFVKAFLARHRVQNDFLVTIRKFDQFLYDLLPQPCSLVARHNGYIADVWAIRSIRERTAYRYEATFLSNEATETTVREDYFKLAGQLAAERGGLIERFEFVPVDGGDFIGPGKGHRLSLQSL